MSFVRQNRAGTKHLLVILNLTPVLRTNYRLGLPLGGFWREVLNSDAVAYGGSNQGNLGGVTAQEHPLHNQSYSAEFTIPPLNVSVFRHEG